MFLSFCSANVNMAGGPQSSSSHGPEMAIASHSYVATTSFFPIVSLVINLSQKPSISQNSTHNCFPYPFLNQPSLQGKGPPWLASRETKLHCFPEAYRRRRQKTGRKKKSLSVKSTVLSQRKSIFKPVHRQGYWLRVFISNLHWYISKLPQASLRTIVWELSPYSHHQDQSSFTNNEGMGSITNCLLYCYYPDVYRWGNRVKEVW